MKEIRTKIPEIVELYSVGVKSTFMASVVHLNQKIEASSPVMSAGWSSSGTFDRFYDKPVLEESTFASAVLSND